MLTEIYLQENNLTLAEKACQTGLNFNKYSIDAELLLAYIKIKGGHDKHALKILKNILEKQPNHFRGLKLYVYLKI